MIEERYTTEKIASIYSDATLYVNQINTLSALSSLTDSQKDKIKRLVGHLECIKGITKKTDNTTSIWTTESFTAIDTAIDLGKTKY
tara:strand:+ start:83 stop:340 length:258 start_codon:yes stop_codon:yes gene_type:complete